MPRKSALATAALDPRGQRLEPPAGLSAAEREAFIATVKSVRPGHFSGDDTPLLVAYAAAMVQEPRHRPRPRGGRGREGDGPLVGRP
jgi:hypothetical protein